MGARPVRRRPNGIQAGVAVPTAEGADARSPCPLSDMVRSASCSVAPPLLGLDEYVPTAEGERSRPRSELLDDGVAAVADGDGVAVGHLRAVQTSLPENRPQGAYGSCSCGTGAFRLNPSLASLVFVRSRIPEPVVFRACDAEPLDDADPAVRLSVLRQLL